MTTDLGKNMPEQMHAFLTDTPDLATCFPVGLCSSQADWAAGRYLSANWQVDEVVAAREDIVDNDFLVNWMRAKGHWSGALCGMNLAGTGAG